MQRNMHNEKLQKLYFSSDIVNRMRLEVRFSRLGRNVKCIRYFGSNP
jgi:hypothetical protein